MYVGGSQSGATVGGPGTFDGLDSLHDTPPYAQNDNPMRRIERGTTEGEFETTATQLGEDILLVSNNTNTISKMVTQIGTSKDTQEFRDMMHNLVESTKDLAQKVGVSLKRLSTLETAGGSSQVQQRRIRREKLQRDFQYALEHFQTVTKRSAAKSREFVTKARQSMEGSSRHMHPEDEEKEGLLQAEERARQEQEFDTQMQLNEAIIAEREAAIRETETTVRQVADIFKDLAFMVHEQGVMIDNIESNIANSLDAAERSNVELAKAAQSQKKARTRKCVLLLCLVLVVIIVVLSIHVSN